MKTALVIGGTGAQGVPVVKALASDSKYAVRVITRNASSKDAIELATIPGVTILEGNTYHEPTLREALKDVDYVFANTNGFAIGEMAEIYWGIRIYELCRESRVKHFIYASLEYASKLGNFDPKYRCGHVDGKGKVADYISAQPITPMAWTVVTSCMYMEGLSEFLQPFPDREDPSTLVFAAPLGDGKCPLIYLEDYGHYVRWVFDTPSRSSGMQLHVATEDIAWKDLAAAFTKVTGRKAVYKDLTLDEYFKLPIFPNPEMTVGHSTSGENPTLFTFRENFSGFWNMWKDNLTKRDYELLDEILPSRVKSVQEWMEKSGYTGEPSPVLKDYRDGVGSRNAPKT
ncbi:NmrA-like family domain-containing protein 1 [Metarhizium brunneum]|uniref:NmrA-like family domain-containing protein 1 n=1 Tax=Metarhizium brunneum TaxID=500148 RepID=A0A7D5YYD3_9HYPO